MIKNMRDKDNFLRTLRIWNYQDIIDVFNEDKDIEDLKTIDNVGLDTNADLLYKETGEDFELTEADLIEVFDYDIPIYDKGKVFASVYFSKDNNYMFLELNSTVKGEGFLRLDHIVLDRRDENLLLDEVEKNIENFNEMIKRVNRKSILTKHKVLRLMKWATIRQIIGKTGEGKCYICYM